MINKLLIKLGLRKPPEPDLPTLRAHDWNELEAERLRIRQRVHGFTPSIRPGHVPGMYPPGLRAGHTPPRPLPSPSPAPAPRRHYADDSATMPLESFVSMLSPSPAPAPSPEPAPAPFASGGDGDFGGGGATGSWDEPSPSPSPTGD